ncbi:saccharopine dehydrogenase NADP-binding domain-containing protein [bacterium]|nr:saccharopine dehydrogenase NADP-binding domain-containing protein [bacterium]
MKAVVLGAAGAMAAVAIKDLLESVDGIEITAADLRLISHPDSRVHAVTVDVNDIESTAKILEGHDVVLNCVNYYFNVAVMKSSLLARVPYIDLGGLYHGTLKQYELHDHFRNAGIPALLGMGSTPGITNVMAGALVQQMDTVEELQVRVACQDGSASGPLPIPYSLDTILDEFAMQPMVFRDGKPEAVAPMSGSEILDFPSPVGKVEALYTLHSEVAMFPRSFSSLREASFKVAFPESFTSKMRFLVELGMASRDPIVDKVSPRKLLLALAGNQNVPQDLPRDCDILQVTAKGKKKDKNITLVAQSIILPHPEWKIGAGALDTGVPLSIGAQMLANKTINEPGVLNPEIAVPRERFIEELKRRRINITFSIENTV